MIKEVKIIAETLEEAQQQAKEQLKTDNVEYMCYMFGKCSSLIEVEVSIPL